MLSSSIVTTLVISIANPKSLSNHYLLLSHSQIVVKSTFLENSSLLLFEKKFDVMERKPQKVNLVNVCIICFLGTILDTYKIVLPSLDLMACRNQKFANIQEIFMDHGGCLIETIGDFGLADEGITNEDDGIRGMKSYLAPESVIDNYPDWPIEHMNTWICSVGDVNKKKEHGFQTS
ncbi:unnamed protein product [Citrullus colocynthis]|uniref:Protein kinase domain-containing protein n=1 Tax=Citrullus colocynthis TaxID=252529 RepID=A0ABP0YGK0_9ROSI